MWYSIVLDLHFEDSDAFAVTKDHVITINGMYYDNSVNLQKEYSEKEREHHFVNGTSYKDIIFHELGHIVANIYRINPLQVLKDVTGLNSNTKLMRYALQHLSNYSVTSYENNGEIIFDAGEVIAECFCGYYSNSKNELA